MTHMKEFIVLGITVFACCGCAHAPGGDRGKSVEYMEARADACGANPGERIYRNPYLRSRGIGESVCAY